MQCSIVANGIVFLRDVNERGPTAVLAGFNCIKKVTKYFYFTQETVSVTENLIIFHTINLKPPAVSIEEEFIKYFHSGIEREKGWVYMLMYFDLI